MAERVRIGNAEIAVATDAEFSYAPVSFLPKGGETWRRYLGGADPAAIMEARVMTFVIRSQGKTILVDTGVGRHGLWRWGDGVIQNVPIKLNEYSHVAATFDGKTMKVYLNGKPVASQTYATPLSLKDHVQNFRVGQGTNGAGSFAGRIDEAAVFDYAIPQAMVAERYYEAKRSYQGLVMSDTPLAYWRLGEATGTVANDETASNINGTYVNAPTLGSVGAVAGDSSTAPAFNGTSQYITAGDNFDFAGTQAFSFEAWVYPTAIDSNFRRVASKEDWTDEAGRQGWLFWLWDQGSSNYMIGFERHRDGVGQGVLPSSVPIKLNEYSHLAATFDGKTMKIFLNGEAIGSQTFTTPLSLKDHAQNFRVGQGTNGAGSFAGRIDEAAVYDYALSAQSVSEHYKQRRLVSHESVVRADGPQAYWRLGETSGTVANDETASNIDGTYVGSPTLGSPGGAAGDSNTAPTFNGSSQYVTAGDNFDFAGTQPFSFEAWVYPTTIDSNYRRFATKEDQGDPAGRQGWLFWLKDLQGGGCCLIGF